MMNPSYWHSQPGELPRQRQLLPEQLQLPRDQQNRQHQQYYWSALVDCKPKAPPADLETYAPIGSEASPYAFHSYRLSYMQSDRVLGLLKALGYSTVEYSAMRGESVNESIFTALAPVQRYPIIVKILDAAKTSLLQPALDGGRSPSGADRLSGTYLHQSTTGAPEQRFLIIYEKEITRTVKWAFKFAEK